MIGWPRFAWARAHDAAAPLLAIAVTTAPGITGEGVGAARAALAEIGSDVGDAVDARVQVSGPLRDLLATIEADIEQGRGDHQRVSGAHAVPCGMDRVTE